MQKKNAANAPQIVESQNASDDATRAASCARSGKAAICDGIAPELIAAGEQESARRGVTLPELIADYLRAFTPARLAAQIEQSRGACSDSVSVLDQYGPAAGRLIHLGVVGKLLDETTEEIDEVRKRLRVLRSSGKSVEREEKHLSAIVRRRCILKILFRPEPSALDCLFSAFGVELSRKECELLRFLHIFYV